MHVLPAHMEACQISCTRLLVPEPCWQGCEAMSPTSDIVTDANLGCQEDQVAFFQSALRAVFGCVSFESSASLELLARWVRRAAVLEFAREEAVSGDTYVQIKGGVRMQVGMCGFPALVKCSQTLRAYPIVLLHRTRK
jgi:hypothetical protein